MKASAQTLALQCKCGGDMFDIDNGSYMITSDTKWVQCDICEKRVHESKFPKTARLFA
jgi:hypothetical protein